MGLTVLLNIMGGLEEFVKKKIILIALLGNLDYAESLRESCNYFYQKTIYQNDT